MRPPRLADIRRKTWAEMYPSTVRRATPQAPPRLFGQFPEVVRFSETFAGPSSQTLLVAPMATAGLAVGRYLVRALILGEVTGGEGESVKFENTGGG